MNDKKRMAAAALAGALALSLTACGGSGKNAGPDSAGSDNNGAAELTDVTICLDWTPNTNHTACMWRRPMGYYEDAGLNVSIVQPAEDGATAIAAAGQVEFAVTVQDSLASAFAREDPLGVTAVAALLQHNTSGIITRPRTVLSGPRIWKVIPIPLGIAPLSWQRCSRWWKPTAVIFPKWI